MSKQEFTQEQIENWKAYDTIRESGVINMYDSITGCELSGLTKDEWMFTMKNYTALKAQAAGVIDE